MFILTVKDKFGAAHFLPNYEGDCRNMHGHTWRVEATWMNDEPLGQLGISLDFKMLKEVLGNVLAIFDHTLLNQVLPVPTAEIIAEYIYSQLAAENVPGAAHIDSVTVHETENSKVTYIPTNESNG